MDRDQEHVRALSDRITKLEVIVDHLSSDIQNMSEKVTTIHDLFQQAKGAKWFLFAAASLGGFLATKAAAIIGAIAK